MPRIYLCDDAPGYRRLVREVLASEADIQIVGEGSDGCRCLDDVAAQHPDVVVLDLDMPGMGGLEALPRLRRLAPETAVLVLSTAPGEDFEERAIELGATAYLQKPTDVLTLAGAMREKVPALDRRSAPRAA